MPRSRILLADDHKLLLEAFKNLLEPEFEVVGSCSDGREVIAAAIDLKPDVLVMDIWMPLLNGLDAGRQLKQLLPRIKIIYLTVNQDPDLAAEAFRIGASGYVLKTVVDRDLVEACRAAMRGEAFIYPGAMTDLIRDYLRQARDEEPIKEDPLTPREQEVVKLIAESYSTRQIADALVISEKTVDRHRANILDKLGMHDRVELTRYAIRRGLVQP